MDARQVSLWFTLLGGLGVLAWLAFADPNEVAAADPSGPDGPLALGARQVGPSSIHRAESPAPHEQAERSEVATLREDYALPTRASISARTLLDLPMDWTLPRSEWESVAQELISARIASGLSDDAVRWNAITASRLLADRLRSLEQAIPTRLALEDLIVSPTDAQQRRLATGLLQVHSLRGQTLDPHVAGSELIAASFDYLLAGRRHPDDGHVTHAPNRAQSVAFALEHLDRMKARLADELLTRSAEDAFVLAFLLGKGGFAEYAHLSAPILVDHLRDNPIRDDALMSMEALVALGSSADPWLWSAFRRGDEQQVNCVKLIFLEAETPPIELQPGQEAATLNQVTWKYPNPAHSWRYLKDDNSQGGGYFGSHGYR